MRAMRVWLLKQLINEDVLVELLKLIISVVEEQAKKTPSKLDDSVVDLLKKVLFELLVVKSREAKNASDNGTKN